MKGGELIREARLRAGITQAELARRIGSRQPVIARWESGRRSPTFETVVKAIRACGLELGVGIFNYDRDHDFLIDDQLARTPEERISALEHSQKVVRDLQSAVRIG